MDVLGGELTVESSLGQGTTVTMSLPIGATRVSQ
jgi:signal transduction histidine kinase